MKYNLENGSSIFSVYDDVTGKLETNSDTVIEETKIRRIKNMRDLFIDSTGFDDDMPLYFMFNGIYRKQHESVFKKYQIRFEYTMIASTKINGECIKTYGHIHGISPLTNKNYLEVYEILNGVGYIELFKYINEEVHVMMVLVQKGDSIIIPSDYFHVCINIGSDPFIYSDLIIEKANSDYSHLKSMSGAPLFVTVNEDAEIEFKVNNKYRNNTLFIAHATADSVPWNDKQNRTPLYARFVANPESFSYLQ